MGRERQSKARIFSLLRQEYGETRLAASAESRRALRLTPRPNIDSTKCNAKQISGYESKLRCPNPDDTYDDAINGCQYPASPESSPHQDCRKNRQNTRQIVEPHVRKTSPNSFSSKRSIHSVICEHDFITEVIDLVLGRIKKVAPATRRQSGRATSPAQEH